MVLDSPAHDDLTSIDNKEAVAIGNKFLDGVGVESSPFGWILSTILTPSTVGWIWPGTLGGCVLKLSLFV